MNSDDGLPNGSADALLPQRVRVMQVIAAGLIAGVAVLLTVMVVIVQVGGNGPAAPPADLPVVSLVAAVVALAALPLSFVVPLFQARQALGQGVAGPPDPTPDGEKLQTTWQATTLLGYGLTEAPAVIASIAYLIEAHPLALGVAGICFAAMLLRFPTEGRVRAWLARQAAALAELREQHDLTGGR